MTVPLPVTVIGGYLGSGKTTLVNHLLRHANGLRLAVLVNEFGTLAIDEDLIEAKDDDIISIAGGCVCCSFGSDLSGALLDMAALDPPPDHLIIESSGVAIPSAIVGAVSLLDGLRVDGVVILADAENILAHARSKYMSDTVLRQIEDANFIVLNKTDLVSESRLAEITDWLRKQNPDLQIVPAEYGGVAPQVVLGSFPVEPKTGQPFHHTGDLATETLIPEYPANVEALARKLIAQDNGLIRAKGFATTPTGQKMLLQIVGNRWEISEASGDPEDGIVCLRYQTPAAHPS